MARLVRPRCGIGSWAGHGEASTARWRWRSRGHAPLAAHCHLGLGHSPARGLPRAGEHLTIATTMYREMDMRFWLEQAEAQLKNLEG